MVAARNGEEEMGKYIDTDVLECIAWNEADEGDGTFAEGVLFVLDKIASMSAADTVSTACGRWIERQAPHAMGGVSAKLRQSTKLLPQLRGRDERRS